MTRYMLEVPRTDSFDDWSDDRIWAELQERLRAEGEPALAQGAFVERDVLDPRVRVVEPMQNGRIYLTGDAAHLITPAGGKGMNLAIQDALELAAGLRERYSGDGDADVDRLARYSSTRLPAIWRTQEFSNWMLTLLHALPGEPRVDAVDRAPDAPSGFGYGLRRARLQELIGNPRLRRWFAHAYAGVDP
jgi:p-hydroxybenzoate 3-monooxygenase